MGHSGSAPVMDVTRPGNMLRGRRGMRREMRGPGAGLAHADGRAERATDQREWRDADGRAERRTRNGADYQPDWHEWCADDNAVEQADYRTRGGHRQTEGRSDRQRANG